MAAGDESTIEQRSVKRGLAPRRTRLRRHAVRTIAVATITLGVAAGAFAQSIMSRGPSISPNLTSRPGPTIRTPGDGGFRPTNINPHFPGGWSTSDYNGAGVVTDNGGSSGGSAKSRKKNASSGQSLRAGFFVPPSGERRYVPDEVILTIGSDVSEQTLDAVARRHTMTRLETQSFALTGRTMHRWRLNAGGSVTTMIRALAGERVVANAQPNYLYTLQQQAVTEPARLSVAGPGDPAQYMIGKLHLTDAHRLATGDQVLVAVIDSGIDEAHPDLAGAVAAKFDTLGTDEKPHAHGTEMAGAIASHGRLLGVAPRASLLAVRAFGAAASGAEGTTFRILKGLDWAAGQHARVINMSFAGPSDPALHDALAKARKKGIVLVAAAGNAGPKSPPLFPAADPSVIAVTATDADDKPFAQANRGNHIAVAAPGVDILVPAPDGNVAFTSGTSVAAAHVSGLAALLIEAKPSLKPDEVRMLVTSTARSLGPKARASEVGAGLADPLAALTAIAPKTAATPSAGEQAAGR